MMASIEGAAATDEALSATRLPGHETIYRRMREMILLGELSPGQAVTIHGMQDATGAGMTPVREALRRLVAEGALESSENRRITVPQLSAAELEDIAYARLAIEPRLAELAAARITVEQIEALRRADLQVDAAIAAGDTAGYLKGNYTFHFTLYRVAGSETLLRIAASLWLRIGPSLRVGCARFGAGENPDHHRAALRALENADAAAAAAAISEDIRQGVGYIAEA